MTSKLEELALRCEQATGPDRALNREIALAVGWRRYSPSEIGKSNPGWIAPEDFAGETMGKDGRRRPVLDSLHGATIWREPRDYTASLDAAMTLVPEGWEGSVSVLRGTAELWRKHKAGCNVFGLGRNDALALCAAALRARAQQEAANGKD